MSTEYLVGTTDTNWGIAGNWSGAAVPIASDTVWLDQRATKAIDAGLNQSAVTLAALYVAMGLTQTVGTATAPLQIGLTTWYFGVKTGTSTGTGTGRFYIDLGTVASTGYILNTAGNGSDPGLEPLRVKCNSASTKLYFIGGKAGIATTLPGETSTLSEFDVAGNATVNAGAGLTWTTIRQASASSAVSIASGGTTYNQMSGNMTAFGIGAITNLTVGGLCKMNLRAASGATSTNVIILPGGTLDCSDLPSNITFTNLTIYPGGRLIASAVNPGHVIITNQTILSNCGTLTAS